MVPPIEPCKVQSSAKRREEQNGENSLGGREKRERMGVGSTREDILGIAWLPRRKLPMR